MAVKLKAGVAAPVIVGGRRYKSLFEAGLDSGVSKVTLYKALKKSAGEPCVARGKAVILEAWLETAKSQP